MDALFGSRSAPPAPTPGDIPAAPANLDDLAKTRRQIELARMGRDSLVRDPAVFSPPGSSGIANPRLPVL